jgi:3'(2'), 5'-bisphosphate nucleotidase
MHDEEMATALDAAAKASAYLRDEYARFQAIPDAPADISTHADRQSQEIILQTIRARFPGDALCAEESTATSQSAVTTGDRVWIVDPIDGTRGFARKNGEFSVMIAFVEKGRMIVGVVQQPAVNRLTYAKLGQGCWRRDGDAAQPTRCQVTPVSDLAGSTLTQSRSRTPGAKSRWVEAIAPARVVETYSAGIKLALVARGEADIYLNSYTAFHDWDLCAGHLLVDEAGGKATGTEGQELRYGLAGAWQRHGVLSTNGMLHEAVLGRIRGVAE